MADMEEALVGSNSRIHDGWNLSLVIPDPDHSHDGQAGQQHDGGQQLHRQLQQVSQEDSGGTHNHPDQPSHQLHDQDQAGHQVDRQGHGQPDPPPDVLGRQNHSDGEHDEGDQHIQQVVHLPHRLVQLALVLHIFVMDMVKNNMKSL